jgi:integrase
MIIKVALRQKSISKGRKSLYLDFYPAIKDPETGKDTRREFLKMYIYEKPKTATEKRHNEQTLYIADAIRQKRENNFNKPEIYTEFEKEQLRLKAQGERCFVEYFTELANKRKSSSYDNWVSALKHFIIFTGDSLKFSELSVERMNEFKEYLLSAKSNRSEKDTLSQNSAHSYFNKVKATLKQAHKDGILTKDLNARVSSIKEEETRREVLSIKELNQLINTPCRDEILKKAAIFSALTGLRFVDIQEMTWNQLEYIDEQGYSIKFTQKKTQSIETLPISEQAYRLLGEPRKATDTVFEDLNYSAYKNKHLAQWIKDAGITKKITFHCFRHTFATLQLANGTDIYTVSKMLGHKDLKTTQIYTKVVDKLKREASNKIKLDF